MLGLPYTTNQINHYLSADDYMSGLNSAPLAANLQLSVPRLSQLCGDSFKSCTPHVDKRGFNFTAFGAMLLGIAGIVFGAKCCVTKSSELIKDTGSMCLGGCKKFFSCLNPKNWFKK